LAPGLLFGCWEKMLMKTVAIGITWVLVTRPWPKCGEIDIMEHWGYNQNFVQSAIAYSFEFQVTRLIWVGKQYQPLRVHFHNYSLEWTPTKMIFSVDSNIHYTYEPSAKRCGYLAI
jgi:hypothetical protein